MRSRGKAAVGFASFNNVTVTENFGLDLAHVSADDENEHGRRVEFFNALIDNNFVEKNLLAAEGFAQIFIDSSTVTENRISYPLISGNAGVYVRGSIFTETVPLLESITAQTSVSNLIVGNTVGLSGFPLIRKVDPRFVDPSQRDFTLLADSPALDLEWSVPFPQFDRNGLPREVDLWWVPDNSTPRDLGCFERQF